MQSLCKKPWVAPVVIVLVGAVAFFGGMKYSTAKNVGSVNQFRASGGAGGAGGGARRAGMGARGQFLTGQVTSNDGKSITIKSPDGSSKIVYFSSATNIGKNVPGSIADVVVGKYVQVGGDIGNEGVVTAQSIQVSDLAPQIRMGRPTTTPTTR